jgi:serine/threonine protein kinase
MKVAVAVIWDHLPQQEINLITNILYLMPNLIGTTLKNRYKIIESLGRGGMAEVYKVRDEQRAAFLAMKVLRQDIAMDPIFLRRFQREAQSLSKLQHPNIVRYYGLERDDLLAFLLMEYIEGVSLQAEILRAGGKPFTVARVREVMEAVCAALHYAHNQGLVHCDIKPGNILVEKNGRILLTDFGIARGMDAATATMVGIGTPAYMAPELVKGLDPSPQSDIYSLGIVLYEMLTGGERPFTGERVARTGTTAEKVRWEQVNLKPQPPGKYNKKIDKGMEAAVMRCLEKEPGKRYTGSLALLEAITKGESTPPAPKAAFRKKKAGIPAQKKPAVPKREKVKLSKPPRAGKKSGKGWMLGAVGVAAVGLAIFAGMKLFGGGREPVGVEPSIKATQLQFAIVELTPTPEATSTPDITPTPTRDYRNNPEPITIENISRLDLNTQINYSDNELQASHWGVNLKSYDPESNDLIYSFQIDEGGDGTETKIFSIEIRPDEEFQISEEEIYQHAVFSGNPNFYTEIIHTDNHIEVYSNPDNALIMQTSGLTREINSIEISPGGKYLAVGRADGRVLMWDIVNDEYLDLDMRHQTTTSFMNYDPTSDTFKSEYLGNVYSLTFSPDGQYLVSGGIDSTINIWEVPSGIKVNSLTKHKKTIRRLLFVQDGKYLISTGDDNAIFIWDFKTFNLVSQCDTYYSKNSALSSSEQILAFSGYQNPTDLFFGNNGKFIFVDIPNCRVLKEIESDKHYGWLFFSKDDEFFVFASFFGNEFINLYSISEK